MTVARGLLTIERALPNDKYLFSLANSVALELNPLSIDPTRLVAWHTADEVAPGGYAEKASGPGTKPAVSISGSKAAKGGTTLIIDSIAGGTGAGQATFSTYLDGGTTPIATGTLTASAGVALTGACTGEIAYFPAGTYAVGQRFDQWPNVVIDQSQQGGDLWSNNPGFTPTIESFGWNSKQSLLFDGTASLVWANSQDLANRVCGGSDREFHVYASIQLLSVAAGQCVMNFGSQATPADFRLDLAAGPVWSITKRDAANTAVTVTGGVPDTARHLVEVHHTGTVVSMFVDGVPVTLSGAGAQNVGDMGSLDAAGLGMSKNLAGASSYCNMRLRERCIYGAGHTDFASVRAYMLTNA